MSVILGNWLIYNLTTALAVLPRHNVNILISTSAVGPHTHTHTHSHTHTHTLTHAHGRIMRSLVRGVAVARGMCF